MPRYVKRTELNHPVDEVFRWHTRPGAMERLVPPWEDVEVLDRSGGMDDGGEVTLRFRKGPARLEWTVRHTAFEPNRLFRDEQVQGPFRRWVHTHRFEDLGDGRSAMVDEVEWEPPLGSLGEVFGGGFIESDLKRLFHFRHTRLAGDLARHREAGLAPLRVAITGASGFLGGTLAALLTTGGHTVVPISRSPGIRERGGAVWDPEGGTLDREPLEGVDAVVHLAGESIAGGRWTEEKKRRILDSRVRGTDLLARTLAGLSAPPRTLISSSAVGFYGDRGDVVIREDDGPGEGFLPEVCQAWEDATGPAEAAGIRTVHLRTGVVLSPADGALAQMLPPFLMGAGGRLGDGTQYMSWIDLDDWTGLVLHALAREEIRGPLNATAPHPVSNATFTSVLGEVLGRPTLFPVPALALKALYGEMGEKLLLEGARVLPRKAMESGFRFQFEGVGDSLRHQLGRSEES